MLGSGKTGAVRALVTASSARSRDADVYRRYAAGLYREALLTRGDPAVPEHAVCDVIVNEAALARISERGDDDARHRGRRSRGRQPGKNASRRQAVSLAAARAAAASAVRGLLRDEGRR